MPLTNPIHSAELRSLRAKQLLPTLNRQLQRWVSDLPTKGRLTGEETAPGFIELRQTDIAGTFGLARASVTVGEVVYNLRAALDYSIHAIAWAANENTPASGTQFPIDDDEETFSLRRRGGVRKSDGRGVKPYLRKVPLPVVELVADHQPYNGCVWTYLLRELSNPDKHRTPTGLTSQPSVAVHSVQPTGLVDPDTDTETLRANISLSASVAFEAFPELDVVSTLRELQRKVDALVLRFAERF